MSAQARDEWSASHSGCFYPPHYVNERLGGLQGQSECSLPARNRPRFLGRRTGSLVTIVTELLGFLSVTGIMYCRSNAVGTQEAEKVWVLNSD
jgi:hypothetical protein